MRAVATGNRTEFCISWAFADIVILDGINAQLSNIEAIVLELCAYMSSVFTAA